MKNISIAKHVKLRKAGFKGWKVKIKFVKDVIQLVQNVQVKKKTNA